MSVVGGAKAEVISDHQKQPVMTLSGNYKAVQALLNAPVKKKKLSIFQAFNIHKKEYDLSYRMPWEILHLRL
jgi:hypothetical protein